MAYLNEDHTEGSHGQEDAQLSLCLSTLLKGEGCAQCSENTDTKNSLTTFSVGKGYFFKSIVIQTIRAEASVSGVLLHLCTSANSSSRCCALKVANEQVTHVHTGQSSVCTL